MRKAKKFIQDCIRTFSNDIEQHEGNFSYFVHTLWLTPDEARKAVEIEKEEMMERACNAYCKVCGHYAHTTPTYICRQACDYYKDFKQTMNDE